MCHGGKDVLDGYGQDIYAICICIYTHSALYASFVYLYTFGACLFCFHHIYILAVLASA